MLRSQMARKLLEMNDVTSVTFLQRNKAPKH
jgi:hypothetical protein